MAMVKCKRATNPVTDVTCVNICGVEAMNRCATCVGQRRCPVISVSVKIKQQLKLSTQLKFTTG